jgi:hypothetical protein
MLKLNKESHCVYWFQYKGQREKLQAELTSKILKRSISINALQIPQDRWLETHYWQRMRREAEEEARQCAIMEATRKKIRERKMQH